MKTKILHLVVAFCFLGSLPAKTFALNYTISFTGTGASTMVDSVIVQNLTQGTSITVHAGNVLNLSDVATVIEPLNANDETIRVYPASAVGKSIVSFFAKQAGSTQLSVFSIDGRKIAGINTDLPAGNNTFELSTPKGVFVIQVTGNEYSYTDKMLNTSGMQSNPGIVYTGTAKPTSTGPQKTKSSIPGITTMTYSAGDQLLYKGVSGKYSTIVTDVPTGDKTTNFNFVACMDADGNNYSMVTIGTQLWMAENLKTTHYNDSTSIPLVTDNDAWANLTTPGFCWYNNDSVTYKNRYGALYNWYTVNTGKLAPKGWHVATHTEWTTLQNYLIANGYNYDGSTSGNFIAKSLAATVIWTADTGTGTIGNDLSKNNRSGFSAQPGGCRYDNGFRCEVINGLWWNSTGYDTNSAWFIVLHYCASDMGLDAYDKYSGFSVRCVRDTLSLPTLTTTAASSITTTTATTGGNITNDGGASITARGVCWSTSVNPTIADSITTGGTGAGIFTSDLTGLTANTTYYLRAYATNSVGTAYGTQVSFTTDVTDIDGNVYHTVTIGTQTWMKENLKTTKYNDGTTIPLVTDNDAWANLTTPGFCWYNNDSVTFKNRYGALYNWYAVNTGKLAPKGWHVATHTEWTTLQNYLITNGYNYDGSKSGNFIAKSLADTISWATDTGTGTIGNDLSKNNRSGFSAQPGGCRYDNGFRCEVINGLWWNSTGYDTNSAWFIALSYCNSDMGLDAFYKYSGFSVRCVRDTLSLSTLTTTAASSITTTTATTGGNITNNGGAFITARGVCWSTSANPTIADSITVDGKGTGIFTSALNGLTANTTYYIRAYATNSVGTAYGIQVSFTTSGITVTDKDGNVYHTVTIGTQTWMVENLKTTKYNDGTAIPFITDDTSWWNLTTPGYCWFNNDSVTYKNMYGALYNWYAVNTGKLAPKGWHVATDAEWTTLQNYLITNGYNYDGSPSGNLFAKSLADTIGWASDTGTGTIGNDLSKNNSSGFSALPGGIRDSGGFDNATVAGYWWSSTWGDASDAWSRHLNNDNRILYSNDYQKNYGFSVRCVRDTLSLPTLTTTTVSSIATTTATTGGNITNDGGTPVTARGICWSTSANPTIADSITPCGTGAGTFTSDLTGLTANTTYYIRAYATNSAGTGYGTQLSFTTAVTDKDGNVYHTVTIGTQIWMAENLKTTKYNDGTAIPLVTDNTAWWNLTTPGYCWYNNDSVTYKNTYGALYNWYSVSTGNLAPKGWHVATDAEWTTLQNYLIANGYNYDGSTSNNLFGKSLADTISWATDTGPGAIGNDLSKNNSTGFSALPGGYRDNSGFNLAGWHGYWWSSAEFNTGVAWFRRLINTESDLYQNYVGENYGFSVRCVRDN